MHLAFILVHYHTPRLLERALEAIQADAASLRQDGISYEVIVVDNGSDATGRAVLDALPVHLVTPGVNLGYAGGLNAGVACTDADVFFFMNPDVEVLPGCTRHLLAALDQDAAIAGPRFFWDRTRRLQLPPTEERSRSAELLLRLAARGGSWRHRAQQRWRRHARRHWLAPNTIASSALSGALLAVRRQAFLDVGPLDEGYHLYFEETDWLMRASRQGLMACYVPAAHALHRYNQSATLEPRAATWFSESARRFQQRYYGAWFARLLHHLDAASPPAAAPWPVLDQQPPSLDVSDVHTASNAPLWIEIALSPLGFPAAAEQLSGTRALWRLPEEIWKHMTPGTYYVQVVDQNGHAHRRYTFQRSDAPVASAPTTNPT